VQISSEQTQQNVSLHWPDFLWFRLTLSCQVVLLVEQSGLWRQRIKCHSSNIWGRQLLSIPVGGVLEQRETG
jgi:hypothetical protein